MDDMHNVDADCSDVFPLTRRLTSSILEANPVHRRFMDNAMAANLPSEREHLEQYLSFCVSQGLSIEFLAECYLVILGDTLREQVYFKKHGNYRYHSFAQVADRVYHDETYMSRYMYGLAITSFLWPNHLQMLRFFDEVLPHDAGGSYLEIGPGHGYYLMKAMQQSAYNEFMAVDISETSIELTRQLIEHYSGKTECVLRQEDFLDNKFKDDFFSAVVMGEVLEHVEDPGRFLREIRRVADAQAFIYVTTCINAPAVDHIFLFNSVEHLEAMIVDAGLIIRERCICPYEGKSIEESVALRLPVNVAYSLSRK